MAMYNRDVRNSSEARFLQATGALIVAAVIGVVIYLLIPGGAKKEQATSQPLSAKITITARDRSGQQQQTHLSCFPLGTIVKHRRVGGMSLTGYALRTPAELCGELKMLAPKIVSDNTCSGPGHVFGPETATLVGVVDKHRVSLRVTRRGSCEEQLFTSLLPLLPLATAPTANTGSPATLPGYQPPRGTLSAKLTGDRLTFSLSSPVGEALSHRLWGSKLVLSCPGAGGGPKNIVFTWPTGSDQVTVPTRPPLGTCQLILNEETIFTIKS